MTDHVALAKKNRDAIRQHVSNMAELGIDALRDIPKLIDFAVEALGCDRPTLLAMVRCGELH